MVVRCEYKTNRKFYLVLVATLLKILVVWFPRNKICESGTQLGILFVAGDLPTLEAETRINAKALIVEIPGCG